MDSRNQGYDGYARRGHNILSRLVNPDYPAHPDSPICPKINALRAQLDKLFESTLLSKDDTQLSQFVLDTLPQEALALTLELLAENGATVLQGLQEFKSETEQKADLEKFKELYLASRDGGEYGVPDLVKWVKSQKKVLWENLGERNEEINYANTQLTPYLGNISQTLTRQVLQSFLRPNALDCKKNLDALADNLNRAYESSKGKKEVITEHLITTPTTAIRETLADLPPAPQQWFTKKLDTLLASKNPFWTQAYQIHKLKQTVDSTRARFLLLSQLDQALVTTACDVFNAFNAFSIQPSSVFYSRWKYFCSDLERGISSETTPLTQLTQLTAQIEPFQKIVALETQCKALETEAAQIITDFKSDEQCEPQMKKLDELILTFNKTVRPSDRLECEDTNVIAKIGSLVENFKSLVQELKEIKKQRQDVQEALEAVQKAEAATKTRKEQLFTISQNAGPQEWKGRSTQMEGFEVEEPPKPAATSASSSWWSSLWTSRENASPATTQPTLSSSARKGFSLNG